MMTHSDGQAEIGPCLDLARAWIFDWMEQIGAVKLVLPFSGGGDEGCFEQPEAYAADGTELAVAFNTIITSVNSWNVSYTYSRAEGVAVGTKEGWQLVPTYTWEEGTPMNLAELLEAVGLHVTDRYDWVNNEGGYGAVLFCLVGGIVEGTEHGQRTVVVDMNVWESISRNTTYQA